MGKEASLLIVFFLLSSSFEPDVVCSVSVATPKKTLFCLYVFRHRHHNIGIDCLALRWEIALSVLPKDIATCYRIENRTKD